jgi:hypothetical protein
MTTSKFAALALTGLLSAVSLSSFAATTGSSTDAVGSPANPMGTGMDTNGGAIIDNSRDPRTQGDDTNRNSGAVPNGKMGPGATSPSINKGDDSNIPGAPKQPAP